MRTQTIIAAIVAVAILAGGLYAQSFFRRTTAPPRNCWVPVPAAVAAPVVTPVVAAPVAPPIAVAPPAAAFPPVPPILRPNNQLPTGVAADRLAPAGVEKYSVNGEESGRQAAYQALGGADLADDSKKPTVTVIDADKTRRADTVAKLRAALGDKVKIGEGPPDDFWFESGFVRTGQPTIYAQLPDGTVTHRQDDLAGGVELAITAIRKGLPDYDPAKDPDMRKPPAPPPMLPSIDPAKLLTGNNLLGIVALVVAAFALFLTHRKAG